MALNDLSFTIHRRRPVAAIVAFLAAAALVAIAFATGETEPAIVAILPAMIGVMLMAFRPVEIEGSITDDGIELVRPSMLIPFESIREIEADFDPTEPVPESFRLRVHHPKGVLKIPDAPDVNSIGIYDALFEQFSPSGSREVNPILADYVARHQETFGPERVWTFRADPVRKAHVDVHTPRTGLAIGLAMVLTSIVWMVYAATSHDPLKPPVNTPWEGLAITLLVLGLFTTVIAWARRLSSSVTGIKRWQTSSVAISPVGLAMVQGVIQGELAWDQLRDVKYRPQSRYYGESEGSIFASHANNLRGIVLVVDGARIVIADVYDRPLNLIHDRILRYWKPELREGLDQLEVEDDDEIEYL